MGGCFLFLGPELGEKQDAVAAVRAGLGEPEEISFYAGETTGQDMVSVLRNASLFADSRLIFIKNAEALKKKEDLQALAAYLESPRDDTALIIMSDASAVAKALETPIPPKNKRVFWELFESRKTEWVRSFFSKAGYRIGPAGIEAVLALVENNTGALRQECSRVMLFLNKEQEISAEDVERCLSHTREESAFTLFSRIAQRDLAKSIEVLRSLLLAKESPPGILAGLGWCFRRLLDYLSLGAGAGDGDLRRIGLGSLKARQDYEQAGRRYDAGAVEKCLSLTAEYDILTRSCGADLEAVLMDVYLYKIIQTGRKAPAAR
jgi:DNA polymerase-3 subunit delta